MLNGRLLQHQSFGGQRQLAALWARRAASQERIDESNGLFN